jgi:N-acetylglucosamine kinase-like BadF-type ATPase
VKLFLGVDGGQSSTTALIGDETGRVLGAGSGGPCNHIGKAEGGAKLKRALTECVSLACAQAGLEFARMRFEAACFGMSGGPEDKAAIIAEILQIGTLVNTDDAVIALSGATAGEPGIITIAGTGSIAFGRNDAGRTARAGGWGYIFGDEGGGFDIARQALRAALRSEEGWGPPTTLRDLLLDATQSRSANEALHRFYTDEWPRSRVAKLAQLVDSAAAEGDAVAGDILLAAAQQLAELTASVRGQLWDRGAALTVAYIGGVFRSALLRERFRMLVELEEGSRCAPPVYSPAAGALLEAYRALGLRPALKNVPELKAGPRGS